MPHFHEQVGFDTMRYLDLQAKAIAKVIQRSSQRLYIEFGGKLIHDKHAARVLPGYDENAKVELIKRLCGDSDLIFVVSARDILRDRVRGDFKITYDEETFRVIAELSKHGLEVRNVAVSLLEHGKPVPERILKFTKQLKRRGIAAYLFYSFDDYLHKGFDLTKLDINPYIPTVNPIVSIISPGGGSGKFGICLNQLYHEMRRGVIPAYFKFETFPIHDLSITHPLNLSFMAASADFYDVVMRDKRHGRATSYNRDIQNYELLHRLAHIFPKEGKSLQKLTSATNMGVNMMSRGIVNDEIIQREAAAEIARRVIRYKFEVAAGKEKPKVLRRAKKVLRML